MEDEKASQPNLIQLNNELLEQPKEERNPNGTPRRAS